MAHAAKLWHVAVQHFRSGRLQQALETCEEVLEAAPEHADAYHLAGVLAHQAGRPTDSLQRIQQALQLRPECAEYHNSLGVTLLSVGRPDDAERCFSRAVGFNSTYAEAHHNLGLSRCQLGRRDDALACFDRAAQIKPDYVAALLQKGRLCLEQRHYDEARRCFENAVSGRPPRTPEALYALGDLCRRQGELTAAEQHLREALAARPGHVDAANCLGIVLTQSRRPDEAAECFETALTHNPRSISARANLGTALLESGHADKALPHLEEACRIGPDMAVYHHTLGRCLLRLNRPADAVAPERRAVELQPDFVEAWRYLGLALEQSGQPDDARPAYETALQHGPQDADALFGLSRLSEQDEDLVAAIDYCRRTLVVEPNYRGAHLFLGQLLGQYARTGPEQTLPVAQLRALRAEAVTHLQRAAAVEPSAKAEHALGLACHHAGRHGEALACFEEAVRLDPQLARAHDDLGNSLLELGRVEDAVSHLRRAVALNPHIARARFHLARSGAYDDPDVAISEIESILAGEDLNRQQQILLRFALARLHDQAERYDTAIREYTSGNNLKERPDDVEPDRFVERLIATFTSEFFEERQGWGDHTVRPVFVVGVPRSGTTLVEQILASHSSVHAAGELPDIAAIANRLAQLTGQDYPDAVRSARRDDVHELAAGHDRFLSVLGEGAPRVVDKMPGNYFQLGLIALLFPQASIIHCTRDPRDTCVSCFRNNLDWPFCDLEEMGRYYGRYERIMAHWRKVLPIPIHELPYEEFLADFADGARRLVAHCGLPWEDSCLQFYRTERAVGTPSKWQVRQPVYTSSIGVWRRYESHLQPLMSALAQSIPR